MAGKIFINYRRADDPGFTTALYQRLEAEFGAGDLFMDVEGHIKPGDDFAVVINTQVAAADAMLVVIGPRWAALLEARAGDVNDYVVVEIKAALKQAKRVIPVLVGGANPPRAEQLPKSIRPLARRHAVGLRPDRFKADCQALVTALRAQLLAAESGRPARSDAGIAAAAEQGDKGEGRIKVDARIFHGAPNGWFKPGAGKSEWFQDVDTGPEMVVVPAEPPFAIGRFALTFDEWDSAQAHPEWRTFAGIAPRKANDHSWGRGRQPAIDVSWDDAKAYCLWLSKVTSKAYRLPSAAEWELCCRAGTTTAFWWGDEITTDQANYASNYPLEGGQRDEYRRRTVTVDSFKPNPWGLYQVHGNVWEWCEDQVDSSSRVLCGGSWDDIADILRSAVGGDYPADIRNYNVGFRVAGTL
jgi:formylglycine-generating enzyme required for sulfatase activity